MCVHHWRLAEQNGNEYVPGRCRSCGAERMFKAAYDEEAAVDAARAHAKAGRHRKRVAA